MKNCLRYGAPLLVAILGAGCGTSTPTHSFRKALAAVTTTIAPTTMVPATTTTTAPPPPATTTTTRPAPVIIVETPATTVPTTIPPPPPCQAGGILLIPGTDLVPQGLDAVGTVYWETESINVAAGPSAFNSAPGLCTYVSPPKDMPVVCPLNDAGVMLNGVRGTGTDEPLPFPLWATENYSFTEAPALIPCTYAGWEWMPGTTINGYQP